MSESRNLPVKPPPSAEGGTGKDTVLVKVVSVAIRSTDHKTNPSADAEINQLPHATLTFPR
jgi:hypothetical protein